MKKELYLKTAFCCMACDGDIAEEEIQLIRTYIKESELFEGLDVEKLLNEYISSINAIGMSFLNQYLTELKEEDMTIEEQVQVMKIAIAMIEADNQVLYSEVIFFKRIFSCLNVPNEVIEKEFPDKEDFFLPDVIQQDYEFFMESAFAFITLDAADAN